MPQLRPYQLEAVKDILDKKKILIADDMSMGKCAEAIVGKTAVEKRTNSYMPGLIVCPPSVIDHWEEEIKLWYKKKDQTNVVKIYTSSFDEDIRKAEAADFAIAGFSTMSAYGHTSKIDDLAKVGFRYGIIDEAHNAKNPGSIRSQGVKRMFDSMEYLAILSGTPIPNSVVDIYMLLSLLDKEAFPINVENKQAVLTSFYSLFRQDPEFVRRVLNDRMLRRTVDEYLHLKMPQLRPHDLSVTLGDEHEEVYTQIYENDNIRASSKLIQLVKASIDPNLVSPHFLNSDLAAKIGKMRSSVYDAMDELVERRVDEGGKVLIFSDLKNGVMPKLQERYSRFGALVIDGDVESGTAGVLGEREEIRRKFQRDANHRVLLTTTVMDEGVDLTAATDVIHLTLPYFPARLAQRNRRSQRIGEVQKDYVDVHTVRTRLNSWIPTITEGIENLLNDKKRIITYIMEQPFAITRRDLEEIKNGTTHNSNHLVPMMGSPIKSVMSHFGQLKGQGARKILAHYSKYPDEAQFIANLYASHWEGYYGGNTANLYARVIQVLGETEDLEKKLDIASGPFSLSRRIKAPVTNVDLNPHMLAAGRILETQGQVPSGNTAVRGVFHQLPIASGSYDLAVCSLALHMSRIKSKGVFERELAFREMNRILKYGRYALITLPHTVINESDFDSFYPEVERLGFEVLPFSGFYKGNNSEFRVYLAGLRKRDEPQAEPLGEEALLWHMDRKAKEKKQSTGRKRKHLMPDPKKIEKEYVNDFHHTKQKGSFEDIIRSAVK